MGRIDRRNRRIAAVIGLVVAVGAAVAVCVGAGVFGTARSDHAVFGATLVRWWNEGGWKSFAVVAAIGAVGIGLGLWLALPQLVRNDALSRTQGMVLSDSGPVRGETTLQARALSHGLETDLERIPEIAEHRQSDCSAPTLISRCERSSTSPTTPSWTASPNASTTCSSGRTPPPECGSIPSTSLSASAGPISPASCNRTPNGYPVRPPARPRRIQWLRGAPLARRPEIRHQPETQHADRVETMNRHHARELLGLAPLCTPEEVEAAYRERIWDAHPDRGGSQEQFVAITESRNLLMAAPSAHTPVVAKDDRPLHRIAGRLRHPRPNRRSRVI